MSSQREFKAIFFDLDGTLVDIHGPLYTAVRSALDDLGHAPPLTREHYHQALEQDDPYLGLPEDKRAEYTKLAFAYFLAEIDRTERLELLPHVQETLAELKRRGYATAIITSRPGDSQRLVRETRDGRAGVLLRPGDHAKRHHDADPRQDAEPQAGRDARRDAAAGLHVRR